MHGWVKRWVTGVLLLAEFRSVSPKPFAPTPVQDAPPPFSAVLHFNVYTFSVSATGTGGVRELTIRAFRGSLLLTRFQLPTDGPVVAAEVADLDENRFPELYIYTKSDGSGSFGQVYAWQFLPEYKADITLANWRQTPTGYMGHDSLWIDRNVLCRQYPVYRPGDANAQPSGGSVRVRYRLKLTGTDYTLVPDN